MKGKSVKLTEHFTLEEMTVSQHRDIDNTPTPGIIDNLKKTAAIMEQVRYLLDAPITVTSGYRSPALNNAIGGSSTSAHMDGRACDFICPKFGTPLEICEKIVHSGIEYDQLIQELGRWVHIGIPAIGHAARRQVLTFLGGKSYVKGLVRP